MDIVSILIVVGIIIGALMVLWGVIALVVFLVAQKKLKDGFLGTTAEFDKRFNQNRPGIHPNRNPFQ